MSRSGAGRSRRSVVARRLRDGHDVYAPLARCVQARSYRHALPAATTSRYRVRVATQNLRNALALLAHLESPSAVGAGWFLSPGQCLGVETCLQLRWVQQNGADLLITERGRRALRGVRRSMAFDFDDGLG